MKGKIWGSRGSIASPGQDTERYGGNTSCVELRPPGCDVVILDARSGSELLQITTDGRSWGPSWSPAGDGIAFLNIKGLSTDLRLARLGGEAGAWTVDEIVPLTDVSGLDAASKPDWYIPADQLPPSSPSPAP